jgi:ABC-type Zn2+ transport system substrate-binding protein/surface adhesin
MAADHWLDRSRHSIGGYRTRRQAGCFFSEPQIDHFVMAITSFEAGVRHTIPIRLDGRTQMRNTTMFAFAPALIAIGFGVWAASPANAPASPSIVQSIEPLQMMVKAKELPTVEFADYTFVFAH